MNQSVTHVVILAAGQGTRMKSQLPKVLHAIAGRPMLEHVLDAAATVVPATVTVIVGHGGGSVRQRLAGRAGITFAVQEPQLGTAHALQQAESHHLLDILCQRAQQGGDGEAGDQDGGSRLARRVVPLGALVERKCAREAGATRAGGVGFPGAARGSPGVGVQSPDQARPAGSHGHRQ